MKRTGILMVGALLILGIASSPALAGPRPGSPQESAVQVRIGGFFPEGGGDIWDENESVFSLDVSDFNDLMLGFSYVHSINNNVEVGLNVDFYDETILSQYRDWVDQDGFPILHDTDLFISPMTVDVRFLPGGRHRVRPGGRFVMKPVFYIGGGLGMNYWEYEEVGDFLDFSFDPPEVFPARFKESGIAFETHLLAGVEFPLSNTTNLLFEARQSFSDDEPDGDFSGLGSLELGGFSIAGGLSFRF